MRQLDFADGFETPTAPTQGTLTTTAMQVFADDAAYVTNKGSAAANGDFYYNSTTNNVRYYRSAAWVNLLAQVITGSRASPTAITVAGITASVSAQIEYQFVEGSGGAIDITANPQITAGTFSGQLLVLVGRSDTNTVKLEHGTGLALNGVCFLAADSSITLFWDGTNWVEVCRNDI